jgi:protein-L-isoaspartate(D-aspartate) O-methyltransferase
VYNEIMGFQTERHTMVQSQLVPRGITDPEVLHAMATVPRHSFIPAELWGKAYDDCALPIGEGQTISQPFIVASMAQALELTGTERVLEIGTGSGYAAAVLSLLAGEIYTVERIPELAIASERRLRELGYRNIHVFVDDGTAGLPAYAPFDAIVVPAAAPWVPQPLRDQLAEGGRLVIPVGGRDAQVLIRLRRQNHTIQTERLGEVRFVPLLGTHAWETDRPSGR